MKCKRCLKVIDELEVFPGGLCVDCYEEDFNKQVKLNKGVLPEPDFVGCINLK